MVTPNDSRRPSIPHGWISARISDVAPLQRGFDLPMSSIRPGRHPVVYSNGILQYHERAMVAGPGVVTGRSGTIGKVQFIESDYWPHNTALWVKSFYENDPKFVYYLYAYIDLSQLAAGSGVPTLNRNDVHQRWVSCPPVPEQRAIADALSTVDRLIESLESLIAKKRVVKTGAMQQLLTGKTRLPGFGKDWGKTRFGDICTFLSAASNPRADLEEHGGVGYIHYGNVHAYPLPVLNCASHDLPRIEESHVGNATRLRDGDLVMVDASEDLEGLGKSVEVMGVGSDDVIAGLHTILCRGDSGHWAAGFKAYLQYIPAFKSALMRVAAGISVYTVSKKLLADIVLTLPPPSEQAAIVSVLSDMDAEIAAFERQLDKIRAIKQGAMQQLLTGRIRLARPL